MAEGGRYEIRDGEKVLIERTGFTPTKPVKQIQIEENSDDENAEEIHTSED